MMVKKVIRFIVKKIDRLSCRVSNWCWRYLYAERKNRHYKEK